MMSATGRTLRTALVTWNYPPVPTGIGRAAAAIAEGLTEVGVDVTVFSADRPLGVREQVGNVPVIGCAPKAKGFAAWLRRRPRIGHMIAPGVIHNAVMAEHRRLPFQLIEATNWYAPAARLAARLPGVPLVVRHSTPAKLTTEARTARDRGDLEFAHHLERRTAAAAALSIFNTAASEALLRSHYGLPAERPSRVIGLALAQEFIAAGAAADYPVAGPLTLMFVGRAERRKGFEEVIGALARLASSRPVRLMVCGAEPSDIGEAIARLGLPSGLAERIENYGRAEDGVLMRCLAKAHLVLAPSRTESYGFVYREAAAFGRPLVASAEDASAVEFVRDTGAGVLAEATTADAVAQAVETLVADDALLARCRVNGLRHARSLSRRVLGERTLAAYTDALRLMA